MSSDEEQHLAVADEKLRHLLSLAERILSIREQVQRALDHQYERFNTTLRSRVLIGLSLKTLDSFDRLVVDARHVRAECSHHLKTMAEGFIYAHWVMEDRWGNQDKNYVCRRLWIQSQLSRVLG